SLVADRDRGIWTRLHQPLGPRSRSTKRGYVRLTSTGAGDVEPDLSVRLHGERNFVRALEPVRPDQDDNERRIRVRQGADPGDAGVRCRPSWRDGFAQ